MTRTYIDSGVLIAAIRGSSDLSTRCLAVLLEPDRTFVSSAFLRLELLPKAAYHRNAEEIAFHEWFFGRVSAWATVDDALIGEAEQIAREFGLNALDALHVASAIRTHAEELVTTEAIRKPIHRVTAVSILTV